jgi:hypothetical protein
MLQATQHNIPDFNSVVNGEHSYIFEGKFLYFVKSLMGDTPQRSQGTLRIKRRAESIEQGDILKCGE